MSEPFGDPWGGPGPDGMEPTINAKEVQLIAVKELMAILVVQHGYECTELYDLADEVIHTTWKQAEDEQSDGFGNGPFRRG